MDKAQLADHLFKTAAIAVANNDSFIENLESDGYANFGKFNQILPQAMSEEFGAMPSFDYKYGNNMVPLVLLMEEAVKQAAAQGHITGEERDQYLAKTAEIYPHIFHEGNIIRENVLSGIPNAKNIQLNPAITPPQKEAMLERLDKEYPEIRNALIAHPALANVPDKEKYVETIALNIMQFTVDRNQGFRQGLAEEILNVVQRTAPGSKIGNETIGFIETSAALAVMKGTTPA